MCKITHHEIRFTSIMTIKRIRAFLTRLGWVVGTAVAILKRIIHVWVSVGQDFCGKFFQMFIDADWPMHPLLITYVGSLGD